MNTLFNDILTIVRWTLTLITLLIESILKGIILILLIPVIIIVAILFPLFKKVKFDKWLIFKYATKWQGGFVLTLKIFKLWQ